MLAIDLTPEFFLNSGLALTDIVLRYYTFPTGLSECACFDNPSRMFFFVFFSPRVGECNIGREDQSTRNISDRNEEEYYRCALYIICGMAS